MDSLNTPEHEPPVVNVVALPSVNQEVQLQQLREQAIARFGHFHPSVLAQLAQETSLPPEPSQDLPAGG